jgi:hypothetical protein
MQEFENHTMTELRRVLVDTIVEVRGRDYAFGWIQGAYCYGHTAIDTNRDLLVAQIREYQGLKNATLKV